MGSQWDVAGVGSQLKQLHICAASCRVFISGQYILVACHCLILFCFTQLPCISCLNCSACATFLVLLLQQEHWFAATCVFHNILSVRHKYCHQRDVHPCAHLANCLHVRRCRHLSCCRSWLTQPIMTAAPIGSILIAVWANWRHKRQTGTTMVWWQLPNMLSKRAQSYSSPLHTNCATAVKGNVAAASQSFSLMFPSCQAVKIQKSIGINTG